MASDTWLRTTCRDSGPCRTSTRQRGSTGAIAPDAAHAPTCLSAPALIVADVVCAVMRRAAPTWRQDTPSSRSPGAEGCVPAYLACFQRVAHEPLHFLALHHTGSCLRSLSTRTTVGGHASHSVCEMHSHVELFELEKKQRVILFGAGWFPVTIEALPEGTPIHARVPVYQVCSTQMHRFALVASCSGPHSPWLTCPACGTCLDHCQRRVRNAVHLPGDAADHDLVSRGHAGSLR